MLIDEIKKANIEAMKEKNANKRAIFSVVINKYTNASIEAKAAGKELTDADMLAILQKTIKELNDEAESFVKADRHERAAEIMQQLAYIHNYLPKQLSEAEIKAEIDKLTDKSIPSIMKHFKTNFAGQVDMSLVSRIARGA